MIDFEDPYKNDSGDLHKSLREAIREKIRNEQACLDITLEDREKFRKGEINSFEGEGFFNSNIQRYKNRINELAEQLKSPNPDANILD
ncbi:hypothetical protein [Apilactobacillus xinyiensis]|uniref:hypothetical protein n=1 Tax=Apilactobacillus xinyiensis TaxID=2841032 RepID=UPI001C7D7056|nr:hypothetical protein [Apilactobacillus xinyiensis]